MRICFSSSGRVAISASKFPHSWIVSFPRLFAKAKSSWIFSLQFLSLLLLLLRSVMVSHASSLLLRCFPAVAVAVAPTVAPHQVPSEILLHPTEKFTHPPCALLTLTTENMRTTNPMVTQKMVSHASSLLLRCLLFL